MNTSTKTYRDGRAVATVAGVVAVILGAAAITASAIDDDPGRAVGTAEKGSHMRLLDIARMHEAEQIESGRLLWKVQP